ncbi:alpha/beta hydrolase [Kiloniella spongiae]|uniref:Alpha/beta hydrolase n=1 Tax=Kiloniella spongiae TaxID=1489064 RepID=A0A0H2MHY0_9PROT|nr:alpha/beta hydrolase [Kiloniella spongiae]KLN61806.1 alpha/beta hydrolase [Kiloniella spongiae]
MLGVKNKSDDNLLTHLRAGSGFPLVFIHGYLGGAKAWEDQVQAFKPEFDVIAPELPGYGASYHKKAGSSIEEYANQIINFLSQIGIQKFHLIGHSMGGMIAQQIAKLASERVDYLVCYGTGPLGMMPNRFETLDQSRKRLRSDGVKATAERIASTWFTNGKDALRYQECASLNDNVTTETALAGLRAMETWDGRDAMSSISQKTLVLWGDRDQSYDWTQPESLWTGIKESSLAVMPDCGHNAHMENPELFNSILRKFLPERK